MSEDTGNTTGGRVHIWSVVNNRRVRAGAAVGAAFAMTAWAGACASSVTPAGSSQPGSAGSSATVLVPRGDHGHGGDRPRLTGVGSCSRPSLADFDCGTLTVPLDHSAPDSRTLDLAVTMQRSPEGEPPEPVLLLLTGGPGQPGVRFAAKEADHLAPVLEHYRLVMIDQRGTGATALDCPKLQQQMAEDDLLKPTRDAVVQCSRTVGDDRAFYGTQDTVADLDWLRRALGVQTMAVDGISYGSYVAERYALVHRHHVDHLVLDSVVPHHWTPEGSEQLANITAVRRVLRLVCREQQCTTDPVADLATLVDRRHDGPELLNMLAILSVIRPDMDFVPDMLHQAVQGNTGQLEGWLQGIAGSVVPIQQFSQGLHAATLCMDQNEPWGDSDTPFRLREEAIGDLLAHLPDSRTYPFNAATAATNGLVQVCRWWGLTPPDHVSRKRNLPPVPTLLLVGDHDLSTSVEWGSVEAARAPHGRLVVVEGAGHDVQSQL
ncbi:MAG: alpha/beta hydrolase, partial [Nocardioidaceae bacterium]